MECLECKSTYVRENGKYRGKQKHICVDCHRQFIDDYSPRSPYPDEIKRDCLKMYINGMGFRGIEPRNDSRVVNATSWKSLLAQKINFGSGQPLTTSILES
jgi:transposase-like protein